MNGVWFAVLGPLDVQVDGVGVPLSGRRQERVLAALLLEAGQTVTFDHLVDRVWDTPPATARRQIQDLVTRLRRTLTLAGAPADLIVTQRSGYLLRPQPGGLDTQVFEELVARAQHSAPEEAVPALRSALRLWRGEPLPGLGFDGEAAAWQERRLSALEQCLNLETSLGRHQEVVTEVLPLVERHPLREPLVGVLMRALAAAGRLAEALDVYRALRARLAEELGLDPGAALRELHQSLLHGTSTRQIPALLPQGLSGFTGREQELAALDGILAEPAIAVVSGTAGVGKSALAVHWAHRARRLYPDGQLFVNLRGFDPSGSARAPADVLGLFLRTLGVTAERMPVEQEARVSMYRRLMADCRALVVLDNARDAEQVRPLLPGSPGCAVVVTSRDPLAGLLALEGARPLPLDVLTARQARDLLARRIGAARAEAEPDAVEAIALACARLPLALSIAASRAAARPGFRLGPLARELAGGHPLDELDGGEPALQLRTVFSCSYRTLSSSAARLFRLLGAHPGPDVGVPAAAALAGTPPGETRSALGELTRAHLLDEPQPGRYACHDLLRAYARELVGREEGQEAQVRLREHYTRTAHAAAMALSPHRTPVITPAPEPFHDTDEAFAWFRAEQAVLLSGLAQSEWRIAWALNDFLDRQGRWQESLALQQAALRAAGSEPDGLAHAHRNLGWAYGRLGQYPLAHNHLRRALTLYKSLGDLSSLAYTHGALSGVLERQRWYDQALEHARSAVTGFHATGNQPGRARALNAVGWLLAQSGEYGQALAHCREALAVHQELGDRHGQANTWDSIAYALHHLGEHEGAIAAYGTAIELYASMHDSLNRGLTLVRLGETLVSAGQPGPARQAWLRALELLDELDHPEAGRVRGLLVIPVGEAAVHT
ncbi:BTAD domain-containing putative transcriptional regulator [Nonomuraea sp. NPDC050556]|uniref:AfsR/SARP family transcriptional regulator n=1 Tax=Nonomuraea sp. NPDC050556 TaxID=3364369 RepID=UPI0037B4B034